MKNLKTIIPSIFIMGFILMLIIINFVDIPTFINTYKILVIIILILVVIFTFIFIKKSLWKMKTSGFVVDGKDRTLKIFLQNIEKTIPNFNLSDFRIEIFDLYKNFLEAWSSTNYNMLRKYVSDELYNQSYSQLEIYKQKNYKSIIKDIELVDFKIIDTEKTENNIFIKVSITVECYDYVLDKYNKVIHGSEIMKVFSKNELLLCKSLKEDNNVCPNCNALLENINANKCPYCDTVVITEFHDWIIFKKNIQLQK